MTLRDVYSASVKLARKVGHKRCILPASRLHECEVKDHVPSLFKLYTLARVYRRDIRTLMAWYGLPLR